ncbi:glutamate receptor 2.9-like [Ipomoea triloba]|uniref:glutamate receptor 2.9-like n=1 Tax=Ipomoea triloba TaxID=35885 RepID=UPI00125E036D|nr:glutamate receptor 2.9-like [Ipomoea triloba]
MQKLKCLLLRNLLFILFVVSAKAESGGSYSEVMKIGVVVDLKSAMGAMLNSCVAMAFSEFYSSHSNHRKTLDLRIKDVDSELDELSAVMQLLENEEVHGIIRLLKFTESSIVTALANQSHVPTISFSGRTQSSSNSIQIMPDNWHRSRALAAIFNEFEWQQVVVLHEDNNDGNDFISQLHKAFQDIGIKITYMLSFLPSIDDSTLERELKKLMAIQTRIILVHVGTSLGCRIFPLAKKIGAMRKGYAWVITDMLSNELNSMDSEVIESMEGVIGIKPYVPKSKSLEAFERRWIRHTISTLLDDKTTKLNVYGVLAYDAIWALAMAAEKIEGENSDIKNGAKFWVSNFGPNLLREFSEMKFEGLGGDFEIGNGQLKLVAFEIFNMIGNGEKKIGKWEPSKGITQKLGSVMWPGDSLTKPLDWGLDKLRILIPVREGFPEFVSVPYSSSSQHKPTGLSMDIFYAVLELLPFKVEYEISFYPIKHGNCTRSYDDLLHNISEGKYQVAIGDITIMDDRAPKLEYTHPYMISEIVMVVKNVKSKDMWILFKVFKWELWTMIIVTYFFVGFVVHILQHQSNGLLFWFPIAVLALPESNMVVNRWTAFVLVISFAMGAIIVQCYVGKYSAMVLSDQEQEFSVSKDSMVGYQEGSFVKDFLIKNLNFKESRLRAFSSIEEFHDGMTRGGKKGGIDVIIDESPYAKLMLRKYGSAYKIVGPAYKTGIS